MTTSRLRALSPLGLACVVALVACGGDDTVSAESAAAQVRRSQLSVVAAFYPLEEAARGVGGDLAAVTNLTEPGQGPHDLQLEPRQLEVFDDADLILYLGRGFQPDVEQAIANAPKAAARLDLLGTVDLLPVDAQLAGTNGEVDGEVLEGDVDPHVWLDPKRMIAMVDAITEAFIDIDPDHESDFRANAATYLLSLSGLDGEYRDTLATCRSRAIVTSHRAFGYLADAYDLRQIPIAGISPEVEPDPRTLEAIADEAKAQGVTTIFLETIAPADLAKTVASEIGAQLDLLDPIEGLSTQQLSAGESYASIMRDNLSRLAAGLGCTR